MPESSMPESSSNSILQPRKLGIRYTPPTLVLQYTFESNARSRRPGYRHFVLHFNPTTLETKTSQRIAQALVKRHREYFNPKQISFAQERHSHDLSLLASISLTRQQLQALLSDLKRAHQEHSAHPTAANLLSKVTQRRGSDTSSSWMMPGNNDHLARPSSSSVTASFGDLNKVSEQELEVAKEHMNMDFEQNRMTRDNPGYVYDKRIEFETEEPSDWDENDDDEEEDAGKHGQQQQQRQPEGGGGNAWEVSDSRRRQDDRGLQQEEDEDEEGEEGRKDDIEIEAFEHEDDNEDIDVLDLP